MNISSFKIGSYLVKVRIASTNEIITQKFIKI